jgi:anaerobic selenocysteine-containing dehydrogenase
MRRALSREALFVVGIDVVMTDSMTHADVILPAASHFEYADIYGAYGQTWLQRAAPVIDPVGESLPNTEIFRRLAARFGFDEPCFRDDDDALMRAAVDGSDPRLGGISPERLPLDRALAMHEVGDSSRAPVASLHPATPSGRIELASDDLGKAFGCEVPRYMPLDSPYPLNLISPSSSKRTNSTFGGHGDSMGRECLEIHPLDANARGIGDGDRVIAHNDLGRVALIARVTDRVIAGVVYSLKGAWLASSDSGQTVNALISADARADIVGGACYNDTFVEVVATTSHDMNAEAPRVPGPPPEPT